MFDHKHYVPILKGKDGEFRALSRLSLAARRNITPFIDIPRRDLDIYTNEPKDSIERHLEKKAKKISKLWGTDQEIFVDVYDLDLTLRTANGTHYLDFLFSELRNENVRAIPVLGLDRATDAAYMRAIKKAISMNRKGLCLRLLRDDIEVASNTYSAIKDLVEHFDLPQDHVHLLLDFRDITKDDLSEVTEIATTFLRGLPRPTSWKTITLSSSGFPENLADVPTNSSKALPRVELDLRDKLISRRRRIPRFPAFGDYGICHPVLLDFDPRTHTPSAAIRYTTEREWLVLKAGSMKKHKAVQFVGLSNTLRTRSEYYGADYSWGDQYISDCAEGSVGCGNLTTWRQVGTNHHLTLVANQIANSVSI